VGISGLQPVHHLQYLRDARRDLANFFVRYAYTGQFRNLFNVILLDSHGDKIARSRPQGSGGVNLSHLRLAQNPCGWYSCIIKPNPHKTGYAVRFSAANVGH
jgi:hypothetical protein